MALPKTFLRLTKTDKKDASGCVILKLTRCVFGEDWRELDSVEMISGQGYAQAFRTLGDPDCKPMSMEPIPEAYYWLREKPSWKGKAWDWSTLWSQALGPVWTTISKFDAKLGTRDNFGIHMDWNAASAPGSAGCVVTPSKDVMTKIVKWWEDPSFQGPHILTVNWGLGTVETSNKAITQKPQPKVQPTKPGELPKGEIILKKGEENPVVSSESGQDKKALVSLPFWLWPFKGLLFRGIKWGVVAALTALAAHIPFISPYIDQVVAFVMSLAQQYIQ